MIGKSEANGYIVRKPEEKDNSFVLIIIITFIEVKA